MALMRPMVGHDFTKKKRFWKGLYDLAWHVNWVSKMIKLSSREEKKKGGKRSCLGHSGDMERFVKKLEFLGIN